MLKKIGGGCLGLIGLLVVVLVVIGVIGAITGGGDDKKTEDTSVTTATNSSEPSEASTPKASKPKATPKPTPKPKPVVQAMEVKAGVILKEFDDNEAAADAKYKDKTLRVTGQVGKVDTDILDDDKYIVQVGTGDEYEFVYVNCNDISASVAAKVKKGAPITVVGQFDDGGDLGVELKDCSLVNS